MGIRVLVVQNDPVMGALLRETLVADGHLAETARLEDALMRASAHRPEAIVLDWPERSREAREVCAALRKRAVYGLLVTSVSVSREHLREVFESGADDVVQQPYELDELLLRICAVARRAHAAVHGEDVLRVGAILIGHGEVRVDERPVRTTQREIAMLTQLARRANRTVTTAELGMLVWGERAPTSNAVVAHVNHLRSKLGHAASQLRTVRGVGYLLSSQGGSEDGRIRRPS